MSNDVELWVPAQLRCVPLITPNANVKSTSLEAKLITHCAFFALNHLQAPTSLPSQQDLHRNVIAFLECVEKLLKQWNGTMYHRFSEDMDEPEHLSDFARTAQGDNQRNFKRQSDEYLLVLNDGELITPSFSLVHNQNETQIDHTSSGLVIRIDTLSAD
jgi:hypothetical protein